MLLRVSHPRPLLAGRLLSREKRFIAHVELESGQRVVAHCVNPGAMEGLVRPGAPVWLSEPASMQGRKLAFTWELVRIGKRMIGANTVVSNQLVGELLARRKLRGLSRFRELAAERRYGDAARVDFWLALQAGQHFIEVKNCHLVYPDGYGYFPDAKSERAVRHLHELVRQVHDGHRATVLFTVQHGAAEALRPSDLHDPGFARVARYAARAGVRFRALRVRPTLRGYLIDRELPVDLRPYSLDEVARWREKNKPWSGSTW